MWPDLIPKSSEGNYLNSEFWLFKSTRPSRGFEARQYSMKKTHEKIIDVWYMCTIIHKQSLVSNIRKIQILKRAGLLATWKESRARCTLASLLPTDFLPYRSFVSLLWLQRNWSFYQNPGVDKPTKTPDASEPFRRIKITYSFQSSCNKVVIQEQVGPSININIINRIP